MVTDVLIDAFTYCGEVQTLKMRLALHYDHVDLFYLVEGDHTFSGQAKGWTFESVRHQFAPWADKIRFAPFKAPVEGLDFSQKDTAFNFSSPAWVIENAQRNALSGCLADAPNDALAIVSDLDEFISPETLKGLRDERIDVARLTLMNHYYFMNCRAVGADRAWSFPLVVSVAWWKDHPDISSFRPYGDVSRFIPDAGWHFSYLGGVEAISAKISSFSHTELDRPDINDADHLARSIKNGEDYVGRAGHEFAFYPVSRYPQAVQDLMRKNRNFVRWTLY